MYSIDTNIFLDWSIRRYPEDVFPAVKVEVEKLIVAGRWKAVERVKDEIDHVGSPTLKAWAKVRRDQFVRHDAAIMKEASAITHAYPGLIDPYAQHDEADRYVIAFARLNGWTVVTHETPARTKKNPPRTHYIPDVCRSLGVPCIDLVQLMRAERWKF